MSAPPSPSSPSSLAPAEPVYRLHRGSTSLLLSLPHVGTALPAFLRPRLVEQALAVEDTDWHLEAVYGFARELGASVLVPTFSRYVIDLNRPPGNAPMYPGVNNTELCPTRLFSGEALYRDGQAPDEREVAERVARYWQPYHEALQQELSRLRDLHGHAVLWDGHSIRSELPWLFEGRLPDLNLGTASGASCDASLREAVARALATQQDFSHVVDGRFKGGHITRHYGRPAERLHALQLEMCWSTYMVEAPPYRLDDHRTQRLQPVLRALLQAVLDWRPGATGAAPR